LLLFPDAHDPKSSGDLAGIAAEAMRAFPEVLAPHVIRKAGGGVGSDPALPIWIDVEDKLHQKLGVTGRALVLVRPDGYIGYRGQPADGVALAKHLGGYLVCKS
jgi:hypothetical protein